MKIMHISDLHLGKIVNGFNMLEDQMKILDQILVEIDNNQCDVLVIAGDVYDRAIPPAAAITLFNNFLVKLQANNVKVIAINGNHDSSHRLNYASEILKLNHIHFISDDNKLLEIIEIENVRFHCLGFKSIEQYNLILDEKFSDYNEVYTKIMHTISLDDTFVNVFVDHSYIVSGESETIESDSERQLNLGGSSFVASKLYEKFDLVLAGHIHRHQHIKPNIYYSGSIYPYSFSEQNNNNGYYLYEISDEINIHYRSLQLHRKFVTITGYIEQLENNILLKTDDYVNIELLDTGAINKPLERLRINFPNIMQVTRNSLQSENILTPQAINKLDEKELFEEFYYQTYNTQISESEQSYLNKILTRLSQERNETN